MFFKATTLFAVFAVSAKLVSATPPACLLAAVNTQPNPSDIQAVCGHKASDVEHQIKSLCGANSDAAMSAFQSICKANGASVSIPSGSGSKTGSSTGTQTQMSSMSTMVTVASSSGNPMPTGGSMTPTGVASSASPSSTPNAGGRLHAEEFATLALAAAGLAIFL